jgi:hypothetical protein
MTNVMSPVVGYQYYDSLTDDTNSPIVSPVVSYQFYDSLTDMGTNSVIFSPVASYQYFDALDSSEARFLNSPFVSYLYNIGAPSPSVALHGRVVDASGAPLAAATVTASIFQISQAAAQSAPDGSYSLAPLPTGAYVLKAALAGYAPSTRALTLNNVTARQDFQLKAVAAAPMTTQVSRQPPAAFTPSRRIP